MLLWHLLLALAGFQHSYVASSAAMQPTIRYGESFYASLVRNAWTGAELVGSELKHGDIVVYRSAMDPGSLSLHRLIAIAGDEVRMEGGRLILNGVMVERHERDQATDTNSFGDVFDVTRYDEVLPGGAVHAIQEVADDGLLDNTQTFAVPQGTIFVMGDNRDLSADSRLKKVGMIPAESVVAFVRATPARRDGQQ